MELSKTKRMAFKETGSVSSKAVQISSKLIEIRISITEYSNTKYDQHKKLWKKTDKRKKTIILKLNECACLIIH